MDFTVYTYGGAEILWKVFNSLAILANSTYFHKLSILMTGGALLTVAARAIPAASIPFLFKKWIMPTFFLMAFFWGPKVTVNIVDHVDTNFKASQVANVPFGIAFAASLSTKMSDVLTNVVEKYMTTSDMERFSQVGPMFGARLMHEARTLTIRDPIMRENLKDFTRQCFAWPYIFTNIAPGKKAAMESQDILGFIEANAHKSLGMYWRKNTGEVEFMFCGKCASKVREVIPLEVETGFQALAKRLFGGTEDGTAETRRLKQYFGDAWQYIAKGSSDAANVIQQELMLNAYRAALQDKREEFGLGRNAALSYLNAERGQIQQDESSLIKFALFGTQIPILHSIFLALGLMFFAIVAPFTFTTGGIHLITTFAKFMLWLATWPPLSALLNALGHMYLAKATSGQLIGYGEGLNLMTQSGLADTAYHTYAFVMGLQLSIPAISWALLSGGGGYAMSQLSSYITQSGDSFAAKAGSEIVDGNVSFDSQTMHHKSIANTQLAQQQLSPNINYGSRIDDGTLATTYGQTKEGELDRTPTFQQHLTQMGTNLTQNDASSAIMGWRSEDAYNSGITNTKAAGRQVQSGINQTFGLLKHLSSNKAITDTFGTNNSSNIQNNLSETIDFANQVAKDHNVSVDKAFEMAAGVAASLGLSFGSGKGLGGSIGLNLNGNYKASASDKEALSEHIKSGRIEQFANNLGSVLQHLEDNKGSISDSIATQKMEQAQWHFNESQNYSDQAAANFSIAKNYAESASAQRQRVVSSSSNLTDQALGVLAHKRGVDLHQAAQEATQNPEVLQGVASRQIDLSEVGNRSAESLDTVRIHHVAAKSSIIDAPSHNPEVDNGRKGIGAKVDELEVRINETQQKTKQTIAQQQSKIIPKQQELENRYDDIDVELGKETDKNLMKKTWDKVVK
jgi:conjugal transfer mating pair stabilization protein TraG